MATRGEIYYNKNDGQYYTPDGSGGWKVASMGEMSEASISPAEVVANEQGLPGLAGAWQRWKLKSFGTNAEDDKRYLRDELKLEVVQYGDKPYEFGVKGSDGKIRLVDPDGGGGAFQTAEGTGSFMDSPLAPLFSKTPLKTLKKGLAEDLRRSEEFMRDMLDITVDAIQGAVIGAATMGGVVTGPVTGGAAGAGTEYVRQKIGQALGINRRVDPTQVAVSGAFGGVPPAVGQAVKGTRKLVSGAKEVGEEMLSRIVVRERAMGAGASEVSDVGLVKLRVLDPAKATEPLPSVSSAANSIRKDIAKASMEDFPQTAIVRRMEENAGPVDLVPLLDKLSGITKREMVEGAEQTTKTITRTVEEAGRRTLTVRGKPLGTLEQPTGIAGARKTTAAKIQKAAGEAEKQTSKITIKEQDVPASVEAAIRIGVDPLIPRQAKSIVDRIYGVLNAAGIEDVRSVPAALARRILRMTQDIGSTKKIYDGKELIDVTDGFKLELQRFNRAFRQELERVVEASGQVDPGTGKGYTALMRDIDANMNQLDYWKKSMGVVPGHFDDAGKWIPDRLIEEKMGKKKASQTIRSFFGDTHHDLVKFANEFKQRFGRDILTPLKRAALGTRIGDQGQLAKFPWLTATGGVPLAGRVVALGSMGLAGLGVGYATKSPLYGAAAMGAAGTLSSPAFLISMMKRGQRLPPSVLKAARSVGPVAEGTQAMLLDRQSQALMQALASARERGAVIEGE